MALMVSELLSQFITHRSSLVTASTTWSRRRTSTTGQIAILGKPHWTRPCSIFKLQPVEMPLPNHGARSLLGVESFHRHHCSLGVTPSFRFLSSPFSFWFISVFPSLLERSAFGFRHRVAFALLLRCFYFSRANLRLLQLS